VQRKARAAAKAGRLGKIRNATQRNATQRSAAMRLLPPRLEG